MSDTRPAAVLNRKEVERRTTLARSTIYRKMRANQFPQAIKISESRVGWPESEIERFLSNPMAYTPNA